MLANRAEQMSTNKYKFIGLTGLRASKGLTKRELASESEVSETTLRDAERRLGHRQETVMKIYNALNSPKYYDGTLIPVESYVKRKV